MRTAWRVRTWILNTRTVGVALPQRTSKSSESKPLLRLSNFPVAGVKRPVAVGYGELNSLVEPPRVERLGNQLKIPGGSSGGGHTCSSATRSDDQHACRVNCTLQASRAPWDLERHVAPWQLRMARSLHISSSGAQNLQLQAHPTPASQCKPPQPRMSRVEALVLKRTAG